MRRIWPPSRRSHLLVVATMLLAPLLVAGYQEERTICRQPVSLQPAMLAFAHRVEQQPAEAGSSSLGRVGAVFRRVAFQGTVLLLRFKNQDGIAYPAHVAVAELLQYQRCSPYAIAVQWLKAGAHATTPQQDAVVDAGLLRQAARVGGTHKLATYLNPFLDPNYDPRGRCAIRRLDERGAATAGCG